MLKNKWQQVGEIFTDALLQAPETRSQYISGECGNDLKLLNEVESLLSSHDSAKQFLETPAVYEVAETFVDQSPALNAGDPIKHYKIVRKIGAGGMGEVYLANDTKLERNVAIKILSENFESGQSNLTRFFREAKAASALDHPNIMVIHEIGEYEGTHYIVGEYIKGETLGRLLRKNDYAPIQVVDIAIQIAGGLAAAHKAGIVHRDIKPDNIMLRDDGIIKILDFGLVKNIGGEGGSPIDYNAQTRELLNTQKGMILGTAAYMSPEQARGKPIDSRTDIWSFGVLLFQLLTKKLPFPGETTSDIIASILKSEPPHMAEIVSSIPGNLDQIVDKTLQKNAGDRYQTTDEILSDLKQIRRQLDTHTHTEPLKFRISESPTLDPITDGKLAPITQDESRKDSGNHRSFISSAFTEARAHPNFLVLGLIAAALLAAASYFGFSRFSGTTDQPSSFQKMRLAKLTFEGRATDVVAISPDGKYITYVLEDEGKQSLMVRQVETAGAMELVSPKDVDYNCLEFSPDGNMVYYSVDASSMGHKLFSIPVLGGEPRKILDSLSNKFSISPDGKQIAFIGSKSSLVLVNIDGSDERVLAESADAEFFDRLAWKPDGKTLVVSIFKRGKGVVYLATVSKDGGEFKSISKNTWRRINGVKWTSDGKAIILAGRDNETEFSQVWYVSNADWQRKRITNDFSKYVDIGLTKNGETIATIKGESLFDVWTQGIDKGIPARKISIPEAGEKGFSGVAAVDDLIFYSIRKGYSINLWRVNADGSGNKQLTFDKGINFFPVVSPDEKRILYVSRRSGNPEIWSMDLNGEDQVNLTNTDANESFVSVAPNGKWYFYHRTDKKEHTTVWKMKPDGTSQTQITKDYCRRVVVSNDSKHFACEYGTGTHDQPAKLAVFDVNGGEPLKLLHTPKVLKSRKYLWSMDDKSILYVDYKNRAGNIWAQPLDGGEPKQLTFFESGLIQRFSIDQKRQRFIMSRGNESADVVSISNFK